MKSTPTTIGTQLTSPKSSRFWKSKSYSEPLREFLTTGISVSSKSSICFPAYFLVSLAMTPERSRTATMFGIDIRPLRMSAMFQMNFSSAKEPAKIPATQMIL